MKIIVYCGNRSQEIDTDVIGFDDKGWEEASDEYRGDCVYDWIAENGWLEPTGWRYPENIEKQDVPVVEITRQHIEQQVKQYLR